MSREGDEAARKYFNAPAPCSGIWDDAAKAMMDRCGRSYEALRPTHQCELYTDDELRCRGQLCLAQDVAALLMEIWDVVDANTQDGVIDLDEYVYMFQALGRGLPPPPGHTLPLSDASMEELGVCEFENDAALQKTTSGKIVLGLGQEAFFQGWHQLCDTCCRRYIWTEDGLVSSTTTSTDTVSAPTGFPTDAPPLEIFHKMHKHSVAFLRAFLYSTTEMVDEPQSNDRFNGKSQRRKFKKLQDIESMVEYLPGYLTGNPTSPDEPAAPFCYTAQKSQQQQYRTQVQKKKDILSGRASPSPVPAASSPAPLEALFFSNNDSPAGPEYESTANHGSVNVSESSKVLLRHELRRTYLKWLPNTEDDEEDIDDMQQMQMHWLYASQAVPTPPRPPGSVPLLKALPPPVQLSSPIHTGLKGRNRAGTATRAQFLRAPTPTETGVAVRASYNSPMGTDTDQQVMRWRQTRTPRAPRNLAPRTVRPFTVRPQQPPRWKTPRNFNDPRLYNY